MEGLNVIVGTQYYESEYMAVAQATAHVSQALGENGFVQDVHLWGGFLSEEKSEQIGVELEIIPENVEVAESYLNTQPTVESFERFHYEEVES